MSTSTPSRERDGLPEICSCTSSNRVYEQATSHQQERPRTKQREVHRPRSNARSSSHVRATFRPIQCFAFVLFKKVHCTHEWSNRAGDGHAVSFQQYRDSRTEIHNAWPQITSLSKTMTFLKHCTWNTHLYVRSEVCASGIGGVPVPPLALEPQSPIFARSRTRAVVPREQNATCRPSTLKRKICYDKKILPERRYPRQQLQSYSNVPEFDCNQIQTARQVDLFV